MSNVPKDASVVFPYSVEDLDLSTRTVNCLIRAEILTVEQLCCTSNAHLSTIRAFGKTAHRELHRKLQSLGLYVGCGRAKWLEVSGKLASADDAGVPLPLKMSLRDYFAALAMQAMLANARVYWHGRDDGSVDGDEAARTCYFNRETFFTCGEQNLAELASDSYAIADAMLAARKGGAQ